MAEYADWHVEFKVDVEQGFVEALFRNVDIDTAADVVHWKSVVVNEFEQLDCPILLLINLDGLKVHPEVSRLFGAARADVLSRYTRRSARFGGDIFTRSLIRTSGVIDHADVNHKPTRDEAIQELLAADNS